MKDDEKRFFLEVVSNKKLDERISPRDIINSDGFYMHHKRAWYLLEKWSSKGWYDYGVTLDLGWITSKGYEFAKSIMTE